MCCDTQNAQITEAERTELLRLADENIQCHEPIVHALKFTEPEVRAALKAFIK
jgi:hypothetical protein